MKILFIKPSGSIAEECCCGKRLDKQLPAQMILCASFLRKNGFNVQVNDLQVQAKKDWSSFDILVFWISVVETLYEEMELVKEAKQPGQITVIVPNDLFSREMEIMDEFPEVDALVLLHDRELSLLDFLRNYRDTGNLSTAPGILLRKNGLILDHSQHPPVSQLSHLESAVDIYKELPLEKYDIANILTGKGCPHSCAYCNYQKTTPRKRPIPEIIKDIQYLSRFFKNIVLLDLQIAVNKVWIHEFLTELSKLKTTSLFYSDCRIENLHDIELLKLFKQANFIHLTVGVEHVSKNILTRIGKFFPKEYVLKGVENCKKAGIMPFLCFMIGFPEEDETTIKELEDFLFQPPFFPFAINPVILNEVLFSRYKQLGLIDHANLKALVHSWQKLPYHSQSLNGNQISDAAAVIKHRIIGFFFRLKRFFLLLRCLIKSGNIRLVLRHFF